MFVQSLLVINLFQLMPLAMNTAAGDLTATGYAIVAPSSQDGQIAAQTRPNVSNQHPYKLLTATFRICNVNKMCRMWHSMGQDWDTEQAR